MAQTLEQYTAEAMQAYQPSISAVQAQIDALPGRLETATQNINRNYEQQSQLLNTQKDQAARAASLQAAGSGGSFGGKANIANRKYYEQTYVPAVTQMQTNQANELANARQTNEDLTRSLGAQLAGYQAQANQQALAQYYADQEAEKNRQAQLRAQREANAAQSYLTNLLKNSSGGLQIALDSDRNVYGGFDWVGNDGNLYTAAQVASKNGGDFNNNLYKVLTKAANQGDLYSQWMAQELQNGARFAQNDARNTGDVYLDTLGVRRIN